MMLVKEALEGSSRQLAAAAPGAGHGEEAASPYHTGSSRELLLLRLAIIDQKCAAKRATFEQQDHKTAENNQGWRQRVKRGSRSISMAWSQKRQDC